MSVDTCTEGGALTYCNGVNEYNEMLFNMAMRDSEVDGLCSYSSHDD